MFKSVKSSGYVVLAAMWLASGCGGDDDGGGGGVDAGELIDSGPTLDATPATITVSGTVVNIEGHPQSGASISIPGLLPTTTNGAGEFTIENVETPYNVLITMASEGAAIYYVGLTSAEPELNAIVNPDIDSSGDVDGTVSAGDSDFLSPTPANSQTEFHVALNRGSGFGSVPAAGVASPFSVPSNWAGPGDGDGTVRVLQWIKDADGLATAFNGYGDATVNNLPDEGSDNVGTITMEPVTPAQLAGSVTVGDATLNAISSHLYFDDGINFMTSRQTDGELSFDHLVPDVAAGSACVQIDTSVGSAGAAAVASRGNLSVPVGDLAITLIDDVASPTSPADGASGIGIGSQLEFEDPDNAIHMLLALPTEPDAPSLVIVTTAGQATIPDAGPYGLPLFSGVLYNWFVYSFHGYDTVDRAGEAIRALDSGCGADQVDLTTSSPRQFTTQ